MLHTSSAIKNKMIGLNCSKASFLNNFVPNKLPIIIPIEVSP